MVRLNQKIFISYIVVALLFMVIDSMMFLEKENIKLIFKTDVALILPLIIIGLIGYKTGVDTVKFDVSLGIATIILAVIFGVLIYHQAILFDMHAMYTVFGIMFILICLILGLILGHFKFRNDLYVELGLGSILGVTAITHFILKYFKGNNYTIFFCICGVIFSFMYSIGYHFGSRYL